MSQLFVPRKVARPGPAKPSAPRATLSVAPAAAPVQTSAAQAAKPPSDTDDYPLLLALSLSEYRLWINPELRMDIERCTRVRANDNFFPLSYILSPPSPLSSADVPEAVIAKALRTTATELVDLRMTIPSAEHKRDAGSFEIRPKFWGAADADKGCAKTRKDWDARTAYVENLPTQCNSLAATCRFLLGLLPHATSSKVTLDDYTRIQNIVSPEAEDGDAPRKLSGFALITFKTVEDLETLVAGWPWARRRETEGGHGDNSKDDATRFGFRACSKVQWDELNAEYLAYRARLLREQVATRDAEQPVQNNAASAAERLRTVPAPTEARPNYPPNCLVFVRNLDVGTNKTALRTLFGTALGLEGKAIDDAIDYVDYTKGVDSCHLRLTSTTHATALVAYFTDGPEAQGKAKAELVTGTREAVYWERVPERVRVQAVKRALVIGEEEEPEQDGGTGMGRERKRRKRR
ncbi:RRM-3 domain-containing protein [Mycena kentingensis (nom. inval.)]|nr:RRM-3 domain-containing protein [Mycena kentingensis (nom. inval.)]